MPANSPSPFNVLGYNDDCQQLEYRGVQFEHYSTGVVGFFYGSQFIGINVAAAKAWLDNHLIQATTTVENDHAPGDD